MSSSSTSEQVKLSPREVALLYGLLLAQQAGAADSDDESESDPSAASGQVPMPEPITMPLPNLSIPRPSFTIPQPFSTMPQPSSTMPGPSFTIPQPSFTMPHPSSVMPQPTVPGGTSGPQSQNDAGPAQDATPPMPQPPVPNAAPNPSQNAVPSRPPSPTSSDVATTSIAWRLHTIPLFSRISEKLYGSKTAILPPLTSAAVGYLKLEGYSSRDTTDNLCALVQFLQDHKWEEQIVDGFISATRTKPHWPAKLASSPDDVHAKHAWSLAAGLLSFFSFRDYLPPRASPPRTFHEIVERVFPDPPETTPSRLFRMSKRVVRPERFEISVRDLLEEGFIIEPANDMSDHFNLDGNVVKVYLLTQPSVKMLMTYHQNLAAQAVGMANLGNEILQSYAALTQTEFQENFKLPISLGMFRVEPDSEQKSGFDDLVVITGLIRLFHNNPDFDPKPRLLASRVIAIENALRMRRHWYKRLGRDIRKRKKEEPWMFWGAVLAVFFGICTVIQTITSVWSLVLSS